MALEGYPTLVTIKDINDPRNISRYTDGVFLELKEKNGCQKLSVKREDGNDVQNIAGFYLDECIRLEESSVDGQVECFRHDKTNEIVTITDKNKSCGRLFDKMRKYLKGDGHPEDVSPATAIRPVSSDRSPSSKKAQHEPSEDDIATIEQNLLDALNRNDPSGAARCAEKLAKKQHNIQFALKMNNITEDKQSVTKKEESTNKSMKLKVRIEGFDINLSPDDLYDVTVVSKTKIKKLKEIIESKTNIASNQQYWFINQNELKDDYELNETDLNIRGDPILTLYVSV